jgi:hypothetical protein
MKLAEKAVWSGLIAALALAAGSCPVITDDILGSQQWARGQDGGGQEPPPEEDPFFLQPLPDLVTRENFDRLGTGDLFIDGTTSSGTGAPLDNQNGRFYWNPSGDGAVISVVGEGEGRALKIEHPKDVLVGTAANGQSMFGFIPSTDTYNDTEGKKVLLQYRIKLEGSLGTHYAPLFTYNQAYNNTTTNNPVQVRITSNGNPQFHTNEAAEWQGLSAAQSGWHTVEILLDYGAKRFTGYVDGDRVADTAFYSPPTAAQKYALGSFRFYIAAYNTAMFIDDIRITTDSDQGVFRRSCAAQAAVTGVPCDCGGAGSPTDCGRPGCVCPMPACGNACGCGGTGSCDGYDMSDCHCDYPACDNSCGCGGAGTVGECTDMLNCACAPSACSDDGTCCAGDGSCGYNDCDCPSPCDDGATCNCGGQGNCGMSDCDCPCDNGVTCTCGGTGSCGMDDCECPCPASCECYGLWEDCGNTVGGCSCGLPPGFVVLAEENFESFASSKTFTNNETYSASAYDVSYKSNFVVGAPSGATSSIEGDGGNNVLKLTSTSGVADITYNPASSSDFATIGTLTAGKKVFITYRAKTNGGSTASMPYIYYSTVSGSAPITNNLTTGGRFQYYYVEGGSNNNSDTVIPVNQWHTFGIIIDFSTRKSTFIVDGVKITDSAGFRQVGSGQSVWDLGRLRFYVAAGGIGWVDDIKIGYLP